MIDVVERIKGMSKRVGTNGFGYHYAIERDDFERLLDEFGHGTRSKFVALPLDVDGKVVRPGDALKCSGDSNMELSRDWHMVLTDDWEWTIVGNDGSWELSPTDMAHFEHDPLTESLDSYADETRRLGVALSNGDITQDEYADKMDRLREAYSEKVRRAVDAS